MASDDKATFSVGFDGSQVVDGANDAADALEQLRNRVVGGREALQAMGSALRNLRGKTDEVKAAKDALKKKLDEERAAISAATLALLKQGTSVEKMNALQQKG